MQENIRRTYASATAEERQQGLVWYSNAYWFAHVLADRYGVGVDIAAGVIAAISPNTHWAQNKRDAEKLIAAWKRSPRAAARARLATYGANKRKAIRMLNHGRPELEFSSNSGPKTWNFWRNLLGDGTSVTVDRHAYSIATGTRYSPDSMPSLTAKRYRETAEAYRAVARELGLEPMQLQAVTWVAWHRDESKREKLASNSSVTN
jgi:hypothetical protein